MPHENPFLTLGIPKSALVVEKAADNMERVLGLAEATYRVLSRQYHPDRRGGSAELFAQFTAAIDELRDPETLEFYLSELVGSADVQALRQQRQAQALVSRDTASIERLAQGFAFVDQFSALGITVPTTYFAEFQTQRIVVDVLSPGRGRARVIDVEDMPDNAGVYDINVRYREGSWEESSVDESYRKHWHRFGSFVTDESIKLVGFVPKQTASQAAFDSSSRQMLESAHRQIRLSWQRPSDCWFLSELRYADDMPRSALCVLYRQGRFAVTDTLMGSAPI